VKEQTETIGTLQGLLFRAIRSINKDKLEAIILIISQYKPINTIKMLSKNMYEKDLIAVGLDEKQAKVYLASLELGPASVPVIAR
jgi:phosphatidylglycerophosphatase A